MINWLKKLQKQREKAQKGAFFQKNHATLVKKRVGEFTIGGFYYIKNVGHPKIVH